MSRSITARRSTRRSVPRGARRAAVAVLLHLATLATLATTAGTARAQGEAPLSRPALSGVVGIGVVTLPRYTGSDESRVVPMPIVELEYRGRLFLGGSPDGVAPGLGVHLVRTSALTWDVGLAGSEARSEGRGDALAGMGKRSAAAFATTGVGYRLRFVQASAGLAAGLGEDAGSYGTLGLGSELPLARRWVGGMATGVTVADARNMAYEFGVTPEQSARRQALLDAGDPRLDGVDVGAYAPAGGVKHMRGSASLAYLLSPRSRVVLFAQGTRLSGEAARSPLVRARTSATTGLAIGWGF